MQVKPDMNEKILLSALKGILENTDLKAYEKMIMVVLKVYQAEYGDVFPDFETIASSGGMCKRKAQYVVKDLVKRNIIDKKPRFKELADGTRKQTSNLYQVPGTLSTAMETHKVSSEPINAPCAPASHAFIDNLYASCAPYKASSKNKDLYNLYPSTKNEEEEFIIITREQKLEAQQYACYADVYEKMIKYQGTGHLCFHQMEFLDSCKQFNLPKCLVSDLYPHIEREIQSFHFDSINRTVKKFADRLKRKLIDNPINWFTVTFKNENLKVRSEIELLRTDKVS